MGFRTSSSLWQTEKGVECGNQYLLAIRGCPFALPSPLRPGFHGSGDSNAMGWDSGQWTYMQEDHEQGIGRTVGL
jgi:hypothetical protein